jgi:hypothetical protein
MLLTQLRRDLEGAECLDLGGVGRVEAGSVLLTPQAETRKLLRSTPSRLDLAVASSSARRLAWRWTASSGTGANSPLVVVSSLTGSLRPSGSLKYFMSPPGAWGRA